jgi:hypothetical protein
MNSILKRIAIIPVAAFLLLPMAHANEAVCGPQKVKKVPRLCVALIDQSGAPVPNAILIVSKDGMEIAQGTTGANGKFSFDDLKRGSYKVEIRAEGFEKDQFPIVITNPSKKCKHAVQVLLYVGWLPCRGMVHLVKP